MMILDNTNMEHVANRYDHRGSYYVSETGRRHYYCDFQSRIKAYLKARRDSINYLLHNVEYIKMGDDDNL